MNATQTPTTEAPETVPFSCPDGHIHGRTVTCYKSHGCRCRPCRDRVAKDERDRYARKASGQFTGLVPADRTREHIESLLADGMSQRDLADRSGVTDFTLRAVRTGVREFVHPTTQRAVLAIRPHRSVQAGGRVDATGTHRRIGALMALGYTTLELSTMIGRNRAAVSQMRSVPTVHASSRDAIAELYDRISMVIPADTPDARRARTYAAKGGWPVPLAWDDDTIDDPNAEPHDGKRGATEPGFLTRNDDVVILAALAGDQPEMSPLERRAVITTLNERRWSASRIGRYIDCSVKTVDRIRAELGLTIYDQSELKGAA